MTEDQFLLLARITRLTAATWRKRGRGPGFVRVGTRILYPMRLVQRFIETAARERDENTAARDAL